MEGQITILHLSDIHFKWKKIETFQEDVEEKMIDTIKAHLENIHSELDFVAVTGDIAFSGKAEEYERAKVFFESIKAVLPEKTEFLLVPGNHDLSRDHISAIFSLHTIVHDKEKVDRLLESQSEINIYINVKFKAFREFAKKINPALYRKEHDYFWVKDYRNKSISVLGLNSCWACEDDNDRNNITLGYPQIRGAFKKANFSNRILLMHHPPINWLNEAEFNRYNREIFKKCELILHGHTHVDNALVFRNPSGSCTCLGANASYTKDRNGFIGFQFIEVQFRQNDSAVKVWPYLLDIRGEVRFVPDNHRWEEQEGKDYFEIFIIKKPISPDDGGKKVNRIKNEKKVDFESNTCKSASINDISREYINEFIKQMDERRSIEVFDETFPPDIDLELFLEKTHLLKKGILANAAILLYGKFPQKLTGFGLSSIACTRFKGTSDTDDVLDGTIIKGNLSNQIQLSMDFVKRNIRKGWIVRDNVKREEVYEYPLSAIREAIANAVAHRDYEVRAKCQVRIFDDRIEVWSPGRLVDEISIEELYSSHNSYPRNSIIAKHLYSSLYIEERGLGTVKMIESMINVGLKKPKFENIGSDFVVKLYGPGIDFVEKKDVKPLGIPDEYKDWIRQFHSTMDIDLLAKKGEAITVSLPEVYIPIGTKNPFYIKKMGREEIVIEGTINRDAKFKNTRALSTEEPLSIDIDELLGRKKLVLLRGGAGMGKTTLIKHLVYTITHDRCNPSLKGYLPVMVFLKDLWLIYIQELQKAEKKLLFEDLMCLYLEKCRCKLSWENVSNHIDHQKALFLIDGLDEVPQHLREDLVDIIAKFQFQHNQNRFLLTGRPHGVAGQAMTRFGDDLHDIEPLDEPKIEDFIKKWFRAISGRAVGLGEVTAEGMISDISQHEHISAFTQNPLLLTAVCILYQDGKRIPEQRADLYNRIIDNLVHRRFNDPTQPGKENEILEFLLALSFEAQKNNRKTIEIADALEILKNIFPRKQEERQSHYQQRILKLFNEIEPRCGLFDCVGSDEIQFTHLTFQEFLAAKYMVYEDIDWQPFLKKEWWEETLLLYTGFMSLDRKRIGNDIVKNILTTRTKEEKDEKKRLHLQFLGARAICDFQPVKRDETVVSIAREQMIQLIESDTALEDRFRAGELLGYLGDTRISEDNMVLVPAGEFIRGSVEIDEEEKPVKRIYLDEFMIGVYPVTNREFRGFVEDKGYHREQFWSEEGWQWIQEENITEPGYWYVREWNGTNFPVVEISWYEAVAYANWLCKVTGKPYRLPTEAEWEKSARGTDGRKYPWGNEFDKNFCNSDESGLGRTSPVGIFPKGKSTYGCYDMAGNVWEWCADWFDEKYYKKSPVKNPPGPTTSSHRVIRGGSWIDVAVNCSCAFRRRGLPNLRGIILGFRLARSF